MTGVPVSALVGHVDEDVVTVGSVRGLLHTPGHTPAASASRWGTTSSPATRCSWTAAVAQTCPALTPTPCTPVCSAWPACPVGWLYGPATTMPWKAQRPWSKFACQLGAGRDRPGALAAQLLLKPVAERGRGVGRHPFGEPRPAIRLAPPAAARAILGTCQTISLSKPRGCARSTRRRWPWTASICTWPEVRSCPCWAGRSRQDHHGRDPGGLPPP